MLCIIKGWNCYQSFQIKRHRTPDGAVKLPLWLNLPLKLNKWLISVILLIGDKFIFAYPWYMYLFVYRKTIRADKESQRQKWRGSHATKGRESSKNASTATQCTELHVQVSESLNILCQRYGSCIDSRGYWWWLWCSTVVALMGWNILCLANSRFVYQWLKIYAQIFIQLELGTVELEGADAFWVMKKVPCGVVGNMPISSPTVSSLMNQWKWSSKQWESCMSIWRRLTLRIRKSNIQNINTVGSGPCIVTWKHSGRNIRKQQGRFGTSGR